MGILLKDDRKERLSCEGGRLIADIQKQNSNSLIIKNSKQIHFPDSGSVFAFCNFRKVSVFVVSLYLIVVCVLDSFFVLELLDCVAEEFLCGFG